jgi:hypothetical protein
MNDPLHQQRLTEIRDEFRSLHLKGEFEQTESEPKGGHTRLRFILKHRRDEQAMRQHMKKWFEAHFSADTELVKLDRYSQFTVVRAKCAHCGKRWFEHVPYGGQCLFASTAYQEEKRKGSHGFVEPQPGT